MISVFRYYGNIGVDVPYEINLSVIRVDGDFVVFRLTAIYKNARQSGCRYHDRDKGKNNTDDSFFAGFHLYSSQNFIAGHQKKAKNITSASPLILRQIYMLNLV